MTIFINEKQFEFWKLKRSRVSNTSIASNFGISRQAVSKALLTIDGKIETSLMEMAKANKISVAKINPRLGVLLGRSIPLGVDAIIFVSGGHGIQVWYEHDGNCEVCEEYAGCMQLLWDYADELAIKLNRTADPTMMAEELFKKVKEMV